MEFVVYPTVFKPNISFWFMDEAVIPFPRGGSFLDMGSGCGCIGIFAAKNAGCIRVVCSDIVPAANACVMENAVAHDVSSIVEAFTADVFTGIPESKFDAIFWNYPFIPTEADRKFEDLSDVGKGSATLVCSASGVISLMQATFLHLEVSSW